MDETGAPAPPREGTARWPALPAWLLYGGLAVLVAVSLGVAAVQVFGGSPSTDSQVGAFVSARPSAPAAGPARSKASSTPVRGNEDLAKVCAGWFYPGSPPYAGKSPHPIGVGVRDQPQEKEHRIKAALEVPYTVKERTRLAWTPEPAKAQLVACVTLARTGPAVKKCQGVAIVEATYTLALYEVATGRELLDKRLTGDVTRCPNAVPLGTGDKLAATVSDEVLYKALNRYVVSQSTVSRR